MPRKRDKFEYSAFYCDKSSWILFTWMVVSLGAIHPTSCSAPWWAVTAAGREWPGTDFAGGKFYKRRKTPSRAEKFGRHKQHLSRTHSSVVETLSIWFQRQSDTNRILDNPTRIGVLSSGLVYFHPSRVHTSPAGILTSNVGLPDGRKRGSKLNPWGRDI